MTSLRICTFAAVLALSTALAHAGKDCHEMADGDDLVAPPVKSAKLDAKEAKVQLARETQRPVAVTPAPQRTAVATKTVQTKKP